MQVLNAHCVLSVLILTSSGFAGGAEPCGSQWIAGSDKAGSDGEGASVAAWGDHILMGAPQDDNWQGANAGSVYAYKRVNGVWPTTQTSILAPAALDPGDNFGASVAIDDEWAVVGAPFADPAASSSGAAFLYKHYIGSGWNLEQQLFPGGGADTDRFGQTVAIDGEFAAIASPYRDVSGMEGAGGFYAAYGDSEPWTLGSLRTLPNPQAFDHFGHSLAMDEYLLVGGAPERDANGLSDSGSIGLWHRYYHPDPPFIGWTWDFEIELTPERADQQAGARFGSSVGISGTWDVIAVGAPGQNIGNATGAGKVFIFMLSYYDEWVQVSEITSPLGPAEDAGFGTKVMMYGSNELVITDKNGHIYRFTGLSWFFPNGHWPPPAGASEKFGSAVARSQDTIVVGDSGHDFVGATNAGAAYVIGSVLEPYNVYPSSDSCEHADNLHQSVHIYEGCTTGMSPDGNSTCDPDGSSNDVWYRYNPYVAAWAGDHILDTIGSDFDTVLSIHSGCPASDANQLACDDDSAGGTASRILINLTVLPYQEYYYIRVSGKNGEAGHYVFNFNKVVNPTCAADIAPTGGDAQVNVDDLLAVINSWGACADPSICPADIAPASGDDAVNVDDLLAVINAWGACP